jgi:hypothetical protein
MTLYINVINDLNQRASLEITVKVKATMRLSKIFEAAEVRENTRLVTFGKLT